MARKKGGKGGAHQREYSSLVPSLGLRMRPVGAGWKEEEQGWIRVLGRWCSLDVKVCIEKCTGMFSSIASEMSCNGTSDS